MFRQTESKATLRLVLYRDEVVRLPRGRRGLVVREGVAWMTHDGKDTVLRAGDTVALPGGRWAAVVSAVTGPLVIEVQGIDHPRAPAISRPARYHSVAGGSTA